MPAQSILVVDDEPHIRAILRRLLINEGFDVCEAADGEEAVRLTTRHTFAAIVMDLTMPGMTGTVAMARVRALPRYTRTPIVLITGNAFVRPRHQPAAAGNTLLLTKPLNLDHLLAELHRCLPAFVPTEGSSAVRELSCFDAAELDVYPLFRGCE